MWGKMTSGYLGSTCSTKLHPPALLPRKHAAMKLFTFLVLHAALAFAPSQRPRPRAGSRSSGIKSDLPSARAGVGARAGASTALAAYGDGGVDFAAAAGSVLWGINLYFGFDWLLAPLGLDNDFNPATRTTVALGRLLAGRGLQAAAAPIIDTDGERPELGTRIGTGANLAYAVDVNDAGSGGGGGGAPDWLAERELGLRSEPPLPLRLAVGALYLALGAAAQAVVGAGDAAIAAQTGAVLAFAAGVYEIGRPALPTRAEALLDAELDAAVAAFAATRLVRFGDAVADGVAPVRQDETVNEREIVRAFRGDKGYSAAEVADTQIEMRLRGYGTGRTNAGFIKGLRLIEA